jgi:hypothetical protein
MRCSVVWKGKQMRSIYSIIHTGITGNVPLLYERLTGYRPPRTTIILLAKSPVAHHHHPPAVTGIGRYLESCPLVGKEAHAYRPNRQ